MQIVSPVLALTLATIAVPVIAQAVKVAPDRYAVTLSRADLAATTPAMAQRALARIDRAALASCGGAGGSLREVTRAVKASACWREAVGDTVARIDAPLLSQAWHDRRAETGS